MDKPGLRSEWWDAVASPTAPCLNDAPSAIASSAREFTRQSSAQLQEH